jgi:hypothetical protein
MSVLNVLKGVGADITDEVVNQGDEAWTCAKSHGEPTTGEHETTRPISRLRGESPPDTGTSGGR